MSKNDAASLAVKGLEKSIGQRFCSTCQNYRRLEDGEGSWKQTGKGRTINRWLCQLCTDKRKAMK